MVPVTHTAQVGRYCGTCNNSKVFSLCWTPVIPPWGPAGNRTKIYVSPAPCESHAGQVPRLTFAWLLTFTKDLNSLGR